MMLSCKEVTRLVSQGLDRELSLGERTMLRFHFVICRGCRNVNRVINRRLCDRSPVEARWPTNKKNSGSTARFTEQSQGPTRSRPRCVQREYR